MLHCASHYQTLPLSTHWCQTLAVWWWMKNCLMWWWCCFDFRFRSNQRVPMGLATGQSFHVPAARYPSLNLFDVIRHMLNMKCIQMNPLQYLSPYRVTAPCLIILNKYYQFLTNMSVKLTKSLAVCQWNWLSPCTRSSFLQVHFKPLDKIHPNSMGDLARKSEEVPLGTFFAARESQYPGAQLRYIFFLYTRFYLIPPNSIGDLARKSWVRFYWKIAIFE